MPPSGGKFTQRYACDSFDVESIERQIGKMSSSNQQSLVKESLVEISNRCMEDQEYGHCCLQAMENRVDDIKELLGKWGGSLISNYVGVLFACSSSSSSSIHNVRVNGLDILQIVEEVVHDKGAKSMNLSVVELLASIVGNSSLDTAIRVDSMACMSDMGVPSSYLENNAVLMESNSNEVPMCKLTNHYTANMNDLVRLATKSDFVSVVGHAAGALMKPFGENEAVSILSFFFFFARKGNCFYNKQTLLLIHRTSLPRIFLCQIESGMKMMESLMLLITRLMVHATENYSQFRLSLAKQAPRLVPEAILPFYESVLSTPPGLLGRVFFR